MIIFILCQMCRGDDDQQINYRQFDSSTSPLFNGLNPCWTLLKNLIHMILGAHCLPTSISMCFHILVHRFKVCLKKKYVAEVTFYWLMTTESVVAVFRPTREKLKVEKLCKIFEKLLNTLMPGGNKKVTHTYTNLQLSAAGLFKYVWLFCYHQALKG